jgi:predicted Rossmann fold flavoprotein
MTNAKQNIIIIGAGPAGLMAAITAAAAGARVTVYEQLPRPGSKILASGGGKCNLSNVLPVMEFIESFGRQGRFALPAFELLPPPALREFFARHGVPTVVDDGFHVFPESNSASDILDALMRECEALQVKIVVSSPVKELMIEDNRVSGVMVGSDAIKAQKVIIATGGKGYPPLGGLGIGYALAQQAGHKIVEPVPAMVALRTVEQWPGSCTGISFADTTVAIDLPKFRKKSYRGELLFTHRGVSGPPVIDLSGDAALLLKKQQTVPLVINLFPEHSVQSWQKEFNQWQQVDGKKQLNNLLSRHMPHAVADALCDLAGDIGKVKAAEFKGSGRDNLAGLLTALPLHVNATEGWSRAMVTRGGVALKKINPATLESRLVKGLFFAGEVLDLDGPCGGFNLQWAFSSGALAGEKSVINQ